MTEVSPFLLSLCFPPNNAKLLFGFLFVCFFLIQWTYLNARSGKEGIFTISCHSDIFLKHSCCFKSHVAFISLSLIRPLQTINPSWEAPFYRPKQFPIHRDNFPSLYIPDSKTAGAEVTSPVKKKINYQRLKRLG